VPKMDEKNALDYIRSASFYTSEKYQWIRPIIDAVLNDTFDDSSAFNFVNSLYEGLERQSESESEKEPPRESPKTAENDLICIQKILSIDKIKNIGLVDISEQFPFNDGLNIVYGKNASGKSSLYIAICNTLGIAKQIFPNLNKDDDAVYVKLSVFNDKNELLPLEWHGKPTNVVQGIKVFDPNICTYLVERDQVNQFELTHLKSEYFQLLNNAFNNVSNILARSASDIQNNNDLAKDSVIKVFPQFLEYEPRLTQESIEKFQFSYDQDKELSTLEAKIQSLRKQDLESIIKNLATAEMAGHRIIENFGEWRIERTADEKSISKWVFTLPVKFKEAADALEQHKSLKALVSTAGQSRLGSIFPTEWLQKNTWQQFIDASLSFVRSLPPEDRIEYSSSTCPYCLQKLESARAKELLSAYHALEDENKKLLQQCEAKLDDISRDGEALIAVIERMPKDIEIVNNELPTIGLELAPVIDYARLKVHLYSYIKSVKDRSDIPPHGDIYGPFEQALQEISKLCKRFSENSDELKEGKLNRDKKILELEEKAHPIRQQKIINDNKKLILSYLEGKIKLGNIKSKLEELTSLKQAANTMATRFSKEVPLKLFKGYLEKEYASLRYSPPQFWDIKSITSGPDNKRVYCLRDKRISEIFSEGERKIHALADFLAESELNSFRGLYIFDDPVNSLDEEKMECVRDRLMRLVEDGNQVIVFTHNLVFLNLLVDIEKQKITKITRLEKQVLLEPNVELCSDRELRRRMRTIKDRFDALYNSGNLQHDEDYLRNVYDLMSGYLESFVEVKLFKNIINRYRPNIRMYNLDKLTKFDSTIIEPVLQLYNQTSRKGSRHSQPMGSPPPKYEELKGHYDLLINKFSL
jgi:hypothetical protein